MATGETTAFSMTFTLDLRQRANSFLRFPGTPYQSGLLQTRYHVPRIPEEDQPSLSKSRAVQKVVAQSIEQSCLINEATTKIPKIERKIKINGL